MGQGDLVGGCFEPIRIVGSGGMGTVYEARDTRTGATVALKLLNETSEEDGRRLEREALALRDLSHPAIVRYVAHGTHHDRPYLVMEWLRGEDLCQRLGRGPLGVEETIVLARRVADALAFLHARGILHRDVKPSNVFLEDGEIAKAKLVDFGLAKRPKDLGVTRAGEIVGTAAYMAPEQLRGDVLDVRADVYGLGNVVFEALAGQRPFAGPTTEAVTRILREEPPRLDTLRPDVTPALATLVARMLARERWNRPADGRMVVAELADLEASAAAVDLELGFVWMDPSGKRAVPGISALERRLACVLTVDWDGATFDDRAKISDLARRFGAKVSERPGLRFALSFDEDVPVEDQVILATRAALAASRLSGAATLEVRLGHGDPSDDAPRARRERGGVHVDDATEQLLPSRFTRVYANGWVVVAEQSELDLPRMIGGVIPPFVGRRAELTRLCNVTLDAFSKRTMRAAMITGEPGAGASRLRQEALRRVGAAHPTLALLTVRGDVAFARLPLEALRAAIRRFAWLDGGPEDAHRLRERIRRHVPSALEGAVLEPLLEL
ncbi:MAG TPA: protein kinase, partial [Polyangiaceae bacterium]|nr:protein kinase [Polyangiaceae bacterium]